MSHRYLVLGLLSERPMTGYDIKKYVNVMLSAVTNASYGTLYPTLHKLLKEDAVKVAEIPQKGRPSKKVYSITETGQQELCGWLRKPAAADQVKREFLLKLYLAKNLSAQHIHSLVSNRRDQMTEKLDNLKAEKQAVNNPWQKWVVNYTLSLCKAEIDWLDELKAQIGVA